MDPLELARSLIGFRTESPPGNEGPCARFVADFLRDLHVDGAEVELHDFQEGRSNVVATFGGPEPGLLLAGHMDVVPAADADSWTSPPYDARVRNGRLYGRGSADMKSGIAAMLAAVASVKGKRPRRALSFVATAGEESGFDGLYALVRDGRMKRVRARCGVVGEPTEMKVVRGHRGGLTCRVVFEGRSAHAGDPSLGTNAIESCALFLKGLGPLRRRLARSKDPDLGITTVTPTVVAGGTKSNVIPGSCELTIDSRVVPALGTKSVLDALNSLIDELGSRHADFRARTETIYAGPALSVPPGAEVVKLAESLTGASSGVAAYCTEAPVYCELGTPTVVLGPGSVRQAHTLDEYAPVREVRSAQSVYGRMIEKVCL